MLDGASKGFAQCYNAQAAADSHCQIIVAAAVTQQGNDKLQLTPVTEQVIENTGTCPAAVTADAGYYSQQAVAELEALGATPYVPPERQKHGTSHGNPADMSATNPATDPTEPDCQGPSPPPQTPAKATKAAAARMRERLASDAGRSTYRMRKAIIEPVFGQIKQALGFRQFLLRGYEKVQAEWLLVCASHNLLKMFRSRSAVPALTAS